MPEMQKQKRIHTIKMQKLRLSGVQAKAKGDKSQEMKFSHSHSLVKVSSNFLSIIWLFVFSS
jgi:hypothetical protein